MELSKIEASQIVLESQGLARSSFGAGVVGALEVIEHLGYVQIDTISVVERAHHHVFWSRVNDYRPVVLDQLVSEKKSVFEYWSHAASFLPMRDFRFSLPRKHLYAAGKRHWFTQTSEHKRLRRSIIARIRREGALASRDFESPAGRKGSGWFDRKPAKLVLEQLFMEGRLMSSGRRGFEKLYDLTENVLPSDVDTRFPSESERARHLIETNLRQLGLARPDEIAYLRSALRESVRGECRKMQEEGILQAVKVEGLEKSFLMRTGADSVLNLPVGSKEVTYVLSPFDNLVIQRKRLSEIFGFDYLIECYVPEPKRKFGYFCLPVLQDGKFVGRIDAKADRKTGVLIVRSFHREKRARVSMASLKRTLRAFADFNGCETVEWAAAPSAR